MEKALVKETMAGTLMAGTSMAETVGCETVFTDRYVVIDFADFRKQLAVLLVSSLQNLIDLFNSLKNIIFLFDIFSPDVIFLK